MGTNNPADRLGTRVSSHISDSGTEDCGNTQALGQSTDTSAAHLQDWESTLQAPVIPVTP